MEQNKPDATNTATGNCQTSPRHKTGDTVIKTEEIFVSELYNAPCSELPQKHESFHEETNISQYDIKPCIEDLIPRPNYKIPQRFETFPNEEEDCPRDIKPCITNLPKGPDCELLQTCEDISDEANVSHCDVKSFVPMNVLDGPNSVPETYEVFNSIKKEFQTDVISNGENLSTSHSEPCQMQRFVHLQYQKGTSRQKNETESVTNLDALIPKHKMRRISVLPLVLKDNKVSKSVSWLANSNETVTVCHEDNSDVKRAKIDITNSAILRPFPTGFFQSDIDNLVSQDEDLENDGTIKLSSSWKRMVNPVKNSQFKCNDCGKFFKRKCQLSQHLKAHPTYREDDSDSSECSDARPWSLTSRISFDQNVSSEEEEQLFKCNMCFKKFSKESLFLRHLRTHTGDRPYNCKECGKSFKQSNHLRGHIQAHKGIKPFKCEECGKNFSRTSGLRKHMQLHTGEKQFECEECYKRFRDKYGLQRHFMSIHRKEEQEFECKECHKRFVNSHKLKRHMRGHTGDKPHQCHECGKCFYQSYSLRVHMRKHTGEKPFQCNECGKFFGHKCSLESHFRVHKEGANNSKMKS